jgi:hypothetical protein
VASHPFDKAQIPLFQGQLTSLDKAMSTPKRMRKSADLAERLTQVCTLLQSIDQEISEAENPEKMAPEGAWIVRYRAKGRGGAYWYYKWQAKEAIFVTKNGEKSRNQYIGKAGSPAFLEAVEMMKRRTKRESLQQVRHTLELALIDLIDEATKDGGNS